MTSKKTTRRNRSRMNGVNKGKQKKICVTHFIGIFTLLQWSGTESTMSLWYVFIRHHDIMW